MGVTESKDRPRRLVIDFPNVTSKAPTQTAIDSPFVSRVRVAVNSHQPLVTRVVMEIAGSTSYHVERSGEAGRDLAVVFEQAKPRNTVALTPAEVSGPPVEPEPPITLQQAMANAAAITNPEPAGELIDPMMALKSAAVTRPSPAKPASASAPAVERERRRRPRFGRRRRPRPVRLRPRRRAGHGAIRTGGSSGRAIGRAASARAAGPCASRRRSAAGGSRDAGDGRSAAETYTGDPTQPRSRRRGPARGAAHVLGRERAQHGHRPRCAGHGRHQVDRRALGSGARRHPARQSTRLHGRRHHRPRLAHQDARRREQGETVGGAGARRAPGAGWWPLVRDLPAQLCEGSRDGAAVERVPAAVEVRAGADRRPHQHFDHR